MSRRSAASILALALMIVLTLIAARQSVPYVLFRPGPTVNVLGDHAGKPIIEVSGHKVYRDDGALRMVTISPSGPDDKVSLIAMLGGWLDPTVDVFPRQAVYTKKDTATSVKRQSTAQMTSSQDNAVAAALTALRIGFKSAIAVQQVTPGGPSAGILKPGDLIRAVDGVPVDSFESLVAQIQKVTPGTGLRLQIRRQAKVRDVRVRTGSTDKNPAKALIGVTTLPSYDFPLDVTLNIDQNIGGPSAGMMFALAIYDVLTPGSLTAGKKIAGTGEIDAAGKVGSIGGIGQKLAAAQRDGARLFLVPAKNCAEAARAHYDQDKLRLVRVARLTDAIEDVQAWAKDPAAELTRCT